MFLYISSSMCFRVCIYSIADLNGMVFMKTYIIDYGFDEYWVTDKDPDGGDISGNKDITLPVEVVLKSEYDKVREALENCECTCTYYENEFEQCGRCKVLQNK